MYYDAQQNIINLVQKEDLINHCRNYKPQEIPKMEYPKARKWSLGGLYGFFNSIMP